jgi:[ribosomal protein S5]-alanine N-acetyltransferase
MGAATAIPETPRLRLREVALSDAAFLVRLLNDPTWLENIGDRGVRSGADAEAYIRSNIRAHHERHGYGMYAVELKSAARPIGLCGLIRRDFLPGPDLGVALLPGFVGQGYASEAACELMRHAQRTLGIARLYAIVKSGNQRSIRMLERLAFNFERPLPLPSETGVDLYVRDS